MSCNPERLVFSKHQNTTREPLIRCTKCSKYKTTGANPVGWDDFTRFQSTGIMPNLQSKSLETTVLALLDLTFHPPNGHNVHRQFTTLRPLEDTLSTLSRDQTVVGDLRRRLKASAIEQNTPLHTFWSSARPLTWFRGVGCSCGIQDSLIQPVRSNLIPMFHWV